MKKNVSLRFTPEQLIREAAEILMNTPNRFTEMAPGLWTHVPTGYFECLKESYRKTINFATPGWKIDIRMNKCEKGWLLCKEQYGINTKKLNFGKKHREKLKEGYICQVYQKLASQTTLFIGDNGVAKLNEGGKSRYISIANFGFFKNTFNLSFAKKLLAIRSNNEWIENVISGATTGESAFSPNVPTMEDIRECGSLQQLLSRINILDQPVSAKWFEGKSIYEITNKLSNAIWVNNPIAYLMDNAPLSYADTELLKDTLTMAQSTGNKFFYNIRRLKEKHDKLMVEQMKLTIAPAPLAISPFWREVYTDYFEKEGWELIECAQRLKIEGAQQHHCVGGYSDRINDGSTLILSTVYENSRYTLSLYKRLDNTSIRIGQIMGYGNSQAPAALLEKLDVIVKSVKDIKGSAIPVKSTTYTKTLAWEEMAEDEARRELLEYPAF